jgi:hypothetical protein
MDVDVFCSNTPPLIAGLLQGLENMLEKELYANGQESYFEALEEVPIYHRYDQIKRLHQ